MIYCILILNVILGYSIQSV